MQPKSRTTCQIWITSVKTCCSREYSISKPYGWILSKRKRIFRPILDTESELLTPKDIELTTSCHWDAPEWKMKHMHLSSMAICINLGLWSNCFPNFPQLLHLLSSQCLMIVLFPPAKQRSLCWLWLRIVVMVLWKGSRYQVPEAKTSKKHGDRLREKHQSRAD